MSASTGSAFASVPVIGVTAATGQLGRLVVSQLIQRVPTESIVALARAPDKAKDLGVKVVEGDYSKPDALVKGLEGVHTLLLISSNDLGHRVKQHTNVIEAAKKTGVKHVVFTSLLHAAESPLALAKEYRETEVVLKNSGFPYTILRNGWYTENYVNSIPGALASGAWISAAGDGKVSGAARRDYAEAAVTVVLNPSAHINVTYELAGDDSFTLTQLAAELSKQTGKIIPFRNLPVDEYVGILTKVGLPAEFATFIATTEYEYRNDALLDNSRTLSKLIGRPTTTMATTIAEAIKALA